MNRKYIMAGLLALAGIGIAASCCALPVMIWVFSGKAEQLPAGK